MFTHDEIVSVTAARANGCAMRVTSVSTDTRCMQPGALFVALRGERHDGHEFVREAVQRGAAAVVVDRLLDVTVPQYVVDDTLRAYQELAKYHRGRFVLPLIGVTGTNGKTTVKEMIAALLGRVGRPLASEANYNNHIGVPMTLLRLTDEHTHAVIEMGMNHAGEIKRLSELAEPTVAVITNVGRGHLEFLENVEAVLAAKLEILEGLIPGGTLIAPRESEFFERMRRAAVGRGARVISFGTTPVAEVRCEIRESGAKGSVCRVRCGNETEEMTIGLPGAHNVLNAAAAIAAVRVVEPTYPLRYAAEVLREFRGVAMRCQREEVKGLEIIVDCYNANPESTIAALGVLATHEGGRRIAVLGEMHELGEAAQQCHYEVGRAAGEKGIDFVIAVGEHGSDTVAGALAGGIDQGRVHLARETAEAAGVVAKVARRGDCVLLKGSRKARLEEVLEKLRTLALSE